VGDGPTCCNRYVGRDGPVKKRRRCSIALGANADTRASSSRSHAPTPDCLASTCYVPSTIATAVRSLSLPNRASKFRSRARAAQLHDEAHHMSWGRPRRPVALAHGEVMAKTALEVPARSGRSASSTCRPVRLPESTTRQLYRLRGGDVSSNAASTTRRA